MLDIRFTPSDKNKKKESQENSPNDTDQSGDNNDRTNNANDGSTKDRTHGKNAGQRSADRPIDETDGLNSSQTQPNAGFDTLNLFCSLIIVQRIREF